MNEPTLHQLKEQLDRIERLLASGLAIPVNPKMDDTGVAFLTGGVQAVRELNKRRVAAGRSEAAKKRKGSTLNQRRQDRDDAG